MSHEQRLALEAEPVSSKPRSMMVRQCLNDGWESYRSVVIPPAKIGEKLGVYYKRVNWFVCKLFQFTGTIILVDENHLANIKRQAESY